MSGNVRGPIIARVPREGNLSLDRLFADGPTMSICAEYGWKYLITWQAAGFVKRKTFNVQRETSNVKRWVPKPSLCGIM
jgi:hypothetical protein